MILDLVVLGILLISAAVAFMRGFVREVLTIGSFLGAAAATLAFGTALVPMTRGWIIDPEAAEPQTLFGMVPYEMLAPVIAYGIVFVLTLLALTVVTHMVSKGVHAVGLGPVDRSLGVVFGLIRGVVIVGLLTMVINFVLSDAQREQYFGSAKTYPYVSYVSELTSALLPGRDIFSRDKDDNAEGDKVGHEPLEPGQSGSKSKPAGGYTKEQRQKIENMVESPAQSKKSYTFNN